MRNIQTRILALLLAVLLLLGLTACGEEIAGLTENVFSEPGITETAVSEEIPDEPETPEAPEAEADTGTSDSAVTKGEYYYDLEHVVLYLDRYGVLRTTTSRRTRPAHSAGRAAASKTISMARPSAATVRQPRRLGSRRRRAAATPNATSTQTANRAAAQSGWSFRTTASIFTLRITMRRLTSWS